MNKNRQLLCVRALSLGVFCLSAVPLFAIEGDDSGSALGAGLDWNYKGSKPYQVAYVVWADDKAVGNKKDAEEAARVAYAEITNYFATANTEMRWDEVYDIVTADYGKGRVFAVRADPTAGKQRITHHGLYIISQDGWGFTILANLAENGTIREYAYNTITREDINSRALVTDGISIHDHMLTAFVMPAPPSVCAISLDVDLNTRAALPPDRGHIAIENAVKGARYRVISALNPAGPYAPLDTTETIAEADGLLSLQLPIAPDDRCRFYKIEALQNLVSTENPISQ